MRKVFEGAKQLWKWTGGIPYLRYVLYGVLVFILIGAFLTQQCGTSRLEQKLEQKQDAVTEQKGVVEVKEEKAATKEVESKQADTTAREKVKKAREVRESNISNVSTTDGNATRCAAYPEDKECL